MMFRHSGFGWHPDLPDSRDYSPDTAEIRELLSLAPAREERPVDVDLRDLFFDVQDQQGLNASPAFACAELYEYFERKAHGRIKSVSRRFLYKNARAMNRVSGNVPIDLRTTLKGLVTFGVPPVHLWPDHDDDVDSEPPPRMYAFAQGLRSVRYVRLDERNGSGERTLRTVKGFLAAGFPVVFGFSVPNSISDDGDVPYRPTFDAPLGGQAVLAVGYDDRRLQSTRGALLIRNSWGRSWGEEGHGWLPYAFVENQLAAAFWTLANTDWLRTGEFSRPCLDDA